LAFFFRLDGGPWFSMPAACYCCLIEHASPPLPNQFSHFPKIPSTPKCSTKNPQPSTLNPNQTTISGAAEEISDGSVNGALALGAAYLFRHVLAYWQLGRILVAWDTTPFDYVTSRVEGEARIEDE